MTADFHNTPPGANPSVKGLMAYLLVIGITRPLPKALDLLSEKRVIPMNSANYHDPNPEKVDSTTVSIASSAALVSSKRRSSSSIGGTGMGSLPS